MTVRHYIEIVEATMADILADHHLSIVPVSDNEVLLVGASYTLDLLADRDGVSLIYFDRVSSVCLGYNVMLFLLNTRSESLRLVKNVESVDRVEFIESQIAALAQHLRDAGGDILSGSKDWIASYRWPPVTPGPRISSLMWRS